jgi:hypothetical protein
VALAGIRSEHRPRGPRVKPWQVWEKQDGTLAVPRDATREDLYRLADKILEYAARAPVLPRSRGGRDTGASTSRR